MATVHFLPVSPRTEIPPRWNRKLSTPVAMAFPLRFAQSDSEFSLRFHASYDRLRSLPRRARRALQRRLASSAAADNPPDKLQSHKLGRTLRHRLAWSLAGAALLLALGQSTQAATITVTTTKPEINAGDGLCSLAEAIINANDNAATNPDCTAGDVGPDTITLRKGTHKITASTAYTGPYYAAAWVTPLYASLPPVASQITIEGNGAKISRKSTAAPASVIVNMATGHLTLNNVTVQGGYSTHGGGIANFGVLTVNNSIITGNQVTIIGGGIYNAGYTNAVANINNSIITGNTSYQAGGGIQTGNWPDLTNGGTVNITGSQVTKNGAYFAAGIYSSGGTVTIIDSVISGNQAGSGGGGAANRYAGTLNIQDSLLSKNQAAGHSSSVRLRGGGGVINNANLIVNNSTIEKGKALIGGGIYNQTSGDAIVTNTTISQNQVKSNEYGAGYGGGIDNAGTLLLTNSTISGNKSDRWAGGINNFGTSTVFNSTITKNTANWGGGINNGVGGDLTLSRSLISGNTVVRTGSGPDIFTDGVFTVNDFNLFGSDNHSGITGSAGPGATDIVPAAGVKSNKILSGRLKDNGGPPNATGKANSTHALVAGSPAVDAAPCVLGTDQRGVTRPQGAGCDIGAFELGPP